MSIQSEMIKGIKKDVRQGYNNQDIWKLIAFANRSLTIGRSEQKLIMNDIAASVFVYVASLRYCRRNRSASAALPDVKSKAAGLVLFLGNVDKR